MQEYMYGVTLYHFHTWIFQFQGNVESNANLQYVHVAFPSLIKMEKLTHNRHLNNRTDATTITIIPCYCSTTYSVIVKFSFFFVGRLEWQNFTNRSSFMAFRAELRG